MAKTQTENGKAFEYACLTAFDAGLNRTVDMEVCLNEPFETAKSCYEALDPAMQSNLDAAASSAFRTLAKLEPMMLRPAANDPVKLTIQADAAGMAGDVRDVVISRKNWEIGISCKHNHAAVKHSRLSDTIDFGNDWFGYPCSQQYWNEVRPVFDELRAIRDGSDKTALWPDDKPTRYYIPILQSFLDELRRIDAAHPGEIPSLLIHHLLGKNDFYKVITDDARRINTIEGININGSLSKSAGAVKPLVSVSKLKLPTVLFHAGFIPNSQNTILVACDAGWQISMRIHNASSKVEPSLKFDVQLESIPTSIHSQIVSWDD